VEIKGGLSRSKSIRYCNSAVPWSITLTKQKIRHKKRQNKINKHYKKLQKRHKPHRHLVNGYQRHLDLHRQRNAFCLYKYMYTTDETNYTLQRWKANNTSITARSVSVTPTQYFAHSTLSPPLAGPRLRLPPKCAKFQPNPLSSFSGDKTQTDRHFGE